MLGYWYDFIPPAAKGLGHFYRFVAQQRPEGIHLNRTSDAATAKPRDPVPEHLKLALATVDKYFQQIITEVNELDVLNTSHWLYNKSRAI